VLRKKCFYRSFDVVFKSIQYFKDIEFGIKLPSTFFVKIMPFDDFNFL